MNVNVWDVAEPIQALIAARRPSTPGGWQTLTSRSLDNRHRHPRRST